MQKMKLTVLILISIVALSACGKSESTTTTEPTSQNPATASGYPADDIYSMTYKLCSGKCGEATSKIVTWGKPTEIGIAYYDAHLPEDSEAKPITSIEKQNTTGNYFVVKARGTLPGIKKPIAEGRFIPVETFIGIRYPGQKEGFDGPRPNSSIQIVSIEKLPRPDKEDPVFTAVGYLKERITAFGMVKPSNVDRYLYMTNDKPDIKPQQVDPITWQEGQPPQVIPVRKW